MKKELILVPALALLMSVSAWGQDAKAPQITSLVSVTAGTITDDQAKSLDDIAKQAKATADQYYPDIVRILGAEAHPPIETVSITFTDTYKGVAATFRGAVIRVSSSYALGHPDDIPGVIVHEMTHVVQHYRQRGLPGWLVEGIADYVRWFNYEPVSKRPHPKADTADARKSYRVTAAFLNWVVNTHDRDLVKQLNEQTFQGNYTDDLWQKLTGKSLDDLNTEWKATLTSSA